MTSSGNLHIVGVFGAPSPIVDVWPVSCCLVYNGVAAGTATSCCLFYLKLEGKKGILISFSSLFFCCLLIMAKG